MQGLISIDDSICEWSEIDLSICSIVVTCNTTPNNSIEVNEHGICYERLCKIYVYEIMKQT